jgi:hypothetical protein
MHAALLLLCLSSKEHCEQAQNAGNFDFFVIHGAPDAPTVDVNVEVFNLRIVNNASYTDQTGYLPVPASSYTLDLQDSSGTYYIKEVWCQASALAGKSGVALASGFLNPATNNNGPSFGIWVALPTGGNLIPLSEVTGISNISKEIGLKYFPNPTNGILNVNFNTASSTAVAIDILDLSGNVVKTISTKEYSGQNSLSIDMNDLSNGMYLNPRDYSIRRR